MVLGCTSNAGRTPHKRELRIAEDEHDGGMRLQNSPLLLIAMSLPYMAN